MKKSGDSEHTPKLSDELAALEKTRFNLLKWKLVLLIAVLGVIVSLIEKVSPVPLHLALLPVVSVYVAVYVDMLYYICSLRLFSNREYKRIFQRNRQAFLLEECGPFCSTIAVCLLVMSIGASASNGKALITFGVVGILLSAVIFWVYRHSREKLLGSKKQNINKKQSQIHPPVIDPGLPRPDQN